MNHYLKRELYELIKSDESIFDFIQASSLDGLWYWDLQNPEHEWMNPKFWTTLGYDPADMPHRADAWQDIIFPEDRDEALRRVQAHFANPDVPYDQLLRYRHKNGSTVWIRCRGLAIRDENGTPVRMLGAHVDVTDLKEAEARERQNAEFYKTILDNQKVFIVKTDIQANYTYVNDFFLDTFHLERDAIIGTSSMDSIYEEDHPKVIDTSVLCLEYPHQTFTVTLRKPMYDGSLKVTTWDFTGLTDAPGNAVEILCIGVDVTQQMTAEAARRASEAQFRFIAENTSDGIVVFNYDNISYASPAYLHMFGYTLAALRQHTQHDPYGLVHPEDKTQVMATLARTIGQQQTNVVIEYRSQHQDGRYVWREDRITLLYGSQGLPVQSIVVARDISERKQRETERLRMTALLQDAQRIANMGGWDLDVTTGNTTWTEQVYAIHEVPLGTPTNTIDDMSFYHPDDQVMITNALTQTIEQQLPFDVQGRLITATGKHRWVRVTGYPIIEHEDVVRVVGAFQDISEQKLLEERVRKSEQQLYNTLVSIDDLVFVLDSHGVFQEAYQAQGNFYIPPPAFIGQPYHAVLPAHIGAELDRVYERVRAESADTFSFDYHLEDGGEVFWYSSKASPRTDSEGQFDGFTVVVRDISERKRVEDALRESQKQFELFFNQSLTGFFFMMLDEPIAWDGADDKDSLLEYAFDHQRVTKANQAFLKQYGDTDQTMLGFTPKDFFAHDLAAGKQLWRDFFDRGHWHVETEERRADGSQVFVEGDYICLYDDDGRLTGHFGVQQDVTARKTAEIALEQSEAKFRSYVENANDLILTLSPQGDLLYISPMWEAVTSTSAEGLVGTSFVPILHPEDVPSALEALDTVVTSKAVYSGLVYRSKHGDGTWHWSSANGAPICDDAGNVTAILVTIRDITSDKHAEQVMQATLKRLEQTLAHNAMLMREVHHRVKNNMAVIASLLALQSHGLKDDTAKDALRESRARIVAMAEIHELMYRHDNTKTIAFDDYLVSLVSRMQRSFSRGQVIAFTLETPNLELAFDQAIPLGLIVNELLSNATKYAFAEGHRDAQIWVQVSVESSVDGDRLQLMVTDNGVGLASDEVLETSDSLGMTVIHSLTEQLGGTVTFTNHPDDDTGLRATVRIPFINEQPNSEPPVKERLTRSPAN